MDLLDRKKLNGQQVGGGGCCVMLYNIVIQLAAGVLFDSRQQVAQMWWCGHVWRIAGPA
jgi:hypothetical protein